MLSCLNVLLYSLCTTHTLEMGDEWPSISTPFTPPGHSHSLLSMPPDTTWPVHLNSSDQRFKGVGVEVNHLHA